MSHSEKRATLWKKNARFARYNILFGKGNKLTITAKITFLTIPRPPYGYRYFGSNCWMRMDSSKFTDLACALSFEKGKEFFDGDTANVELVFYNGESLIESFEEGMQFDLRVLDLKVAEGTFSIVSI